MEVLELVMLTLGAQNILQKSVIFHNEATCLLFLSLKNKSRLHILWHSKSQYFIKEKNNTS